MQTTTPSDTPSTHWQQPVWFALAGLLLGLVAQHTDWLYTDANGQFTSWVGLKATLPFALLLFLPVMLLLWKSGRGMSAPLFLAVMLAVAGSVGWQTQVTPLAEGKTYLPMTTVMTFAYYALLLVAVGISLTLVQEWQRGRPHFPYPKLFAHAWENVHGVLLAAAFAGLVFVLLMAAAGLFESVLGGEQGLGAATSLSTKVWENSLLIGMAALGAGIGVILQYPGVLLRLHTLVFALYRLLAYLMAFIIIGFALMLVPQWQTFLNDREAAGIFMALAAVSILFLNTLVDGGGSQSLPRWAQLLFGAQLLVQPLLTGLAVYALGLRVGQYGLSPQRVLGLLLGGLLLVYTVAYALQWARYRRNWTLGLQAVNPPLAMLAAGLALLALTPVLDPQGWSARNQLARLQSGAVEAKLFDYHAVRHTFGKPGEEAIATMQGWHDHPQYAAIRKGIEDAADPYQVPAAANPESVAKVSVAPAGKTVEVAAFMRRAQNTVVSGISPVQCFAPVMDNTECLLVLQDVNGDGKDEGLLLAFTTLPGGMEGTEAGYHIDATLFALGADGMPVRGKSLSNATLKPTQVEGSGYGIEQEYPLMGKAEFEQLKAAAKAGQLTPVMPELPELQVGGQRLREQ